MLKAGYWGAYTVIETEKEVCLGHDEMKPGQVLPTKQGHFLKIKGK